MNTTDSKSCVPGRTELNTTVSRWIRSAKPDLGSARLLSDGEEIAGYMVRRLLGRGGFGEVYEVWHPVMNAAFALKVFAPENEERVARLLTEVRALARIRHPNVIAIHQFGEHKGHPYFIMDLAEPIADELSVAECRRLVADISAALTAVHEAGIVHRDIKPANILRRDGRYLLADFGIAGEWNGASAREGTSSTGFPLPAGLENPTLCDRGRVVVGSPGFIAPEILEGGGAFAVSDVFALASVCLAVCPALAENRKASSVLSRALAAKPQLRQRSAAEFAADFEGAFRSRRGLWIGGGLVAGAIVVAGSNVLSYLSRGRDVPAPVAMDVQMRLVGYADEMTNLLRRISALTQEEQSHFAQSVGEEYSDDPEYDQTRDPERLGHEIQRSNCIREASDCQRRFDELLKRSARLKFNCGIPLTDAEAQAL